MLGRTNTGGVGGGGGLSFQVVGNPRPSNPKENTVWVNTDEEITGHVLSATAPENPTAGMLWMKISDSSNVEIGTPLGKDYITIMLDSVSQYVGGAWVSVEAMSFQNGVWNEFAMYLYRNGNEYESLTGGWTEFTVSGWGSNGILLSKDATGLVLKKDKSVTTGAWPARGYATKNVIDLSFVKAISVLVETAVNKYSSESKFRIGVTDSLGNNIESWKAMNVIQLTTSGTFTYDLDVASVESGFICVTQFDEAAANDITVTVKEARFK